MSNHKVVNVYGEEKVGDIENALAIAKDDMDKAEPSDSEAMAYVCGCYLGKV